MSGERRPDPDDLPESVPDEAEAEVRRHDETLYTAETPQRRQASGAPLADATDDEA